MEYFQIDLQDSGTCDHPTRWSSHPQLSVPGPKLQKVWADMEQKCWETMLELHLGSLVYVRICCSLVSRKKSWEFLLTIASAVSVVWGVQTIRSRRFLCFGLFLFGLVGWSLVEFNDSSTWPKLNWIDDWIIGYYWLYIDQLNSSQFNDGYIWLLLVIGLGRWSSQSLEVFGRSQWWFQGSQAPNEDPSNWVEICQHWPSLKHRSAEEYLDFCRYSESMWS
jgi:hypothetical protein